MTEPTFRSILRLLALATLPTLVLLLPERSFGQTRLLKRFDKNGDGVVHPSEVPESMKGIYRRLAERAGLDPDKPIRIEEASERIEQKVVKQLAEEGVQVSVTVTGARPKLYIRWPGQQGPPSKVVGRGLPPIKPRVKKDAGGAPLRLPSEYAQYDRDRDGQIGLYEWPRRRIAEFLKLDKNQDGFLTPRELGAKPTNTRTASAGGPGDSREQRQGSGAAGPIVSSQPSSAPQPPVAAPAAAPLAAVPAGPVEASSASPKRAAQQAESRPGERPKNRSDQ